MLRTVTAINPDVIAAAELFTDGRITDAVLASVAAMRGLPLHIVTAAPAGPSAAALAVREVAAATAAHRMSVGLFDGARKRLGDANRRTNPPICRGAAPTVRDLATVRRMQSRALGELNRHRAALRAAVRRLDVARAALAAVVS